MSYDPECERLARHFLPPTAPERLIRELAQEIQEAVEDWLESEAERLRREITEPKPPS